MIVIIINIIGTIINIGYVTNLNAVFGRSFKSIFIEATTAPIPIYADNIPRGIPIIPTINDSNNTVFLSCFLVAPIDAKSPNCFFLSITDIANELYITIIQPTDTNNSIITNKPTILLMILPYLLTPYNDNKLVFKSYSSTEKFLAIFSVNSIVFLGFLYIMYNI